MKKLGHIGAALVLAAGVIYFIAVPKDDAAMVEFKAKAAAFIRSDKKSAPLREVLGEEGNRICIGDPSFSTRNTKTGQEQLLAMFPARAAAIEKLDNKDNKAEVVIGIEKGKDLIVMTGHGNIIVDGKTITLRGFEKEKRVIEHGFRCFSYNAAIFSKVGKGTGLYIGDQIYRDGPIPESKPKQKKKPAPQLVKKVSKPVRSYGY